MTAYNKTRVIERFGVPKEGVPILELILEVPELLVLDGFPGNTKPEAFRAEELCRYLTENRIAGNEAAAREWIQRAWKRGVLCLLEDGRYRFGNFYGRLDIFAVAQRDTYHGLPKEQKEALDAWYFQAYVDGLRESLKKMEAAAGNHREGQDAQACFLPTGDQVLTLEEAMAFVENREDTPYLADCDCRVLKEGCGHPVNTCITYRTAENSFARKGLAVPITKEEAKRVIAEADRAGLMHTANPGGLCNCCGDCCYLFRASRELGLWGIWPKRKYRIEAENSCIGCGRCAERCHFGVLQLSADERGRKRIWTALPEQCIGCGICREVCPVQALKLKEDER